MAKTFSIQSVDDWESFSEEHALEISKNIVEVALKNLDGKKRYYHVMDIEIEETDSILEVTLDREEMLDTLEKNLYIHEVYEQYEDCARIAQAITYLKLK